MLKKYGIVAVLSLLAVVFTAVPAFAATTITPANAPQGTHLQSGTIGCTVDANNVVNCTAFQLGGVGNTNATASLSTTYTATVDCTNKGGNLVEVKSQPKAATTSSGTLRSKNGQLDVTALSSTAPTTSQFLAAATCPNGNWTKSLQGDTITLSSFTYTLTFAGFSKPYITITGP